MPDAPGVYFFRDAGGKIIYIGKAKSLKKRVQSYFVRAHDAKTSAMVSRIADVEYQLCRTESLALFLEAGLIRRYHPKYNVSLRDDRSFPFVKITGEAFPAICVTRKKENDGSRYFGPYTSAKVLRQALRIIRRTFPYRTCRVMPRRACMYYRLNLSPGPCIGKIDPRAYAATIERIALILEGKADALLRKLSEEMSQKARAQDFEAAAAIRDQINALSSLSQNVIAPSGPQRLQDLQQLLHLYKAPERIEGFDISDLSGQGACGSMVSFYNGLPDKNKYRRFRIKTVSGIDDYGMLAEVVRRRYMRVIKDKLPLPDLILIDGGRAHLLAAAHELRAIGLRIPLVSIAKEQENIYVYGRPGCIRLDADTPALNLIRHIRDEAHRFALSYHHILRRKKTLEH